MPLTTYATIKAAYARYPLQRSTTTTETCLPSCCSQFTQQHYSLSAYGMHTATQQFTARCRHLHQWTTDTKDTQPLAFSGSATSHVQPSTPLLNPCPTQCLLLALCDTIQALTPAQSTNQLLSHWACRTSYHTYCTCTERQGTHASCTLHALNEAAAALSMHTSNNTIPRLLGTMTLYNCNSQSRLSCLAQAVSNH